MTSQNWAPPHPLARSSWPERVPHPLSGRIPSLLSAEPKGQAVPRGGELLLPSHSGSGRLAWRQSREVSGMMSSPRPCRWPHCLAGGAVAGFWSDT